MGTLKIATFSINGIQTQLTALLAWLGQKAPDIVYLQELRTPDVCSSAAAPERAGHGAAQQGQSAWDGVTILACDSQPLEVRRGLPGNTDDLRSHYPEVAVDGLLVTSLRLPSGNPQSGSKFDYKLAWFEHLIRHVTELMGSGHPVVLAGDFNVVPSNFDIYDTRSWREDVLLQPESRECFERLLRQGWIDTLRQRLPDRHVYTFWDYFCQHWQRDVGLCTDRLLLGASLVDHLEGARVDRWVHGEEHASDHAPAWVSLCLS